MRRRNSGYNRGMEECPLTREFRMNPMRAREFVDGHKRLPLWVRLLYVVIMGSKK